MTNKQQLEFARQLFDDCLQILESKGKAYSGDDDAHANFKETADKIGNTPYQVWATYFGKHVDCIMRAIKANPDAPVDDTEGLRGRIIDAVNYLAILGGMDSRPIPNNTVGCLFCKSYKRHHTQTPCSECKNYSKFVRIDA